MKKLALCLFLTLVFVISVPKRPALSYAADSLGEQKKELAVSATFFDSEGRVLCKTRALSKEKKCFFTLIPPEAKRFHLKINGNGNFFLLEEIEGTSPMIESSDFIGFIDLYDHEGKRFLLISP